MVIITRLIRENIAGDKDIGALENEVIGEHRDLIKRARQVALNLLASLEAKTISEAQLIELADAMAAASVLESLSRSLETLLTLERQAFGINEYSYEERLKKLYEKYPTDRDFEVDTMPPETLAKNVMYESGLSVREEWVATLRRDPDAVLPDQTSLYTAGQLESLFQGGPEEGVNSNQAMAMAKTLARHRFNQVTNDKGESSVPRGPDGKSYRWWIIRSIEEADLGAERLEYMSWVTMTGPEY